LARSVVEADDDWILPVGEALDDARARLIRARFGREAERLGRELADRLRREHPELDVHGRVFGVRTLRQANPFPRTPASRALWLGHVFHPSPAGQPKTYRILLAWDTGDVTVEG
jgi:hypothetical protein